MDFTKLTPGVSVVQGPDGDELTINGQKGIHNNVSVDGADFNNPFFGEQRGGQRPPFTFNLDAVQEVVVVNDGANAEFGRSSGGFVNVVTKSGTNDIHASAHFYYTNDALQAEAPHAGRRLRAEARLQPLSARLHARRTARAGPALLLPVGRLPERRHDQAARSRPGSSSGSWTPSRPSAARTRTAPIARTDDALALLAKVDWRATDSHLLTLRYAYTWSDQHNGTFDVNSWGRSANAIEKDFSKAITGLGALDLQRQPLERVPLPVRPRGPAASLRWPEHPRCTGRPLPDTAFDFVNSYRFGEPFFIPVAVPRRPQPVRRQRLLLLGPAHVQGGRRVQPHRAASQTFLGFANGRFIFARPTASWTTLPTPTTSSAATARARRRDPARRGRRSAAPCSSISSRPASAALRRRSRHSDDRSEGVGRLRAGHVAADAESDDQLGTALGGADRAAADHADPGALLRTRSSGRRAMGRSSRATARSRRTRACGSRASASRGIRRNDGKTVLRATFGIFYARIPGLNLASSRSTDGTRGQSIYRDSTFRTSVRPLPPLILASFRNRRLRRGPNHPGVFVVRQELPEPADDGMERLGRARGHSEPRRCCSATTGPTRCT